MQPNGISVVVPFYNEQGNIIPLVEEIICALKNFPPFEVVMVDDGSQDQTAEQIIGISHNFKNCIAISHKSNVGQSVALCTGIQAAQYDWIITLDGDGQNNPADIPILIKELQRTTVANSVIFGNRKTRKDNWLRRFSSRAANKIRSNLLADKCIDTGCSLKLFPRQAFLNLPHFNHFHRFMPALFQFAGYTVRNVPVSHRPRVHGTSKYGFWGRLTAGIVDLLGVIWLKNRVIKPQELAYSSLLKCTASDLPGKFDQGENMSAAASSK